MDYDLVKVTKKLSSLDLKYKMGAFDYEVFWFKVMKMEDDWSIVRHKHSSFELHLVQKGSSVVILDDREFVVKAGQFYLTKPHEYHEQLNIEQEEYVEYGINLSITLDDTADEEEEFIYQQLLHSMCKPYADNDEIKTFFEMALSSASNERPVLCYKIKHYITLIFIAIVQIICEEQGKAYDIQPRQKKDSYRFKQITQYIKDNITDPIMAKDIAHYAHLSEKQVSRIISAEKDITTKKYINQLRLKKSKEMLMDKRYTIKEISDILGFSSEYYFNKFFKREEGLPPGVFRHNARNV